MVLSTKEGLIFFLCRQAKIFVFLAPWNSQSEYIPVTWWSCIKLHKRENTIFSLFSRKKRGISEGNCTIRAFWHQAWEASFWICQKYHSFFFVKMKHLDANKFWPITFNLKFYFFCNGHLRLLVMVSLYHQDRSS